MKHQRRKREYQPVMCTNCRKIVNRKNFTSHWNKCRNRIVAAQPTFAMPALPAECPQVTPSVSMASSAVCLETVSEANTSASAVGPSPEKLSYIYDRAAKALLKQHHQYTEEDLTEFLAREYPSVPEDQRQALIVGATSAAQAVARLHVLWDGARSGEDSSSKGTKEPPSAPYRSTISG